VLRSSTRRLPLLALLLALAAAGALSLLLGSNLLDAGTVRAAGFVYEGVGRGG
jgi:hypothetical protein